MSLDKAQVAELRNQIRAWNGGPGFPEYSKEEVATDAVKRRIFKATFECHDRRCEWDPDKQRWKKHSTGCRNTRPLLLDYLDEKFGSEGRRRGRIRNPEQAREELVKVYEAAKPRLAGDENASKVYGVLVADGIAYGNVFTLGSQKFLSERTDLTVDAVRAALDRLQVMGLIEHVTIGYLKKHHPVMARRIQDRYPKGKKGRRPNIYKLNQDLPDGPDLGARKAFLENHAPELTIRGRIRKLREADSEPVR